MPKPVKLSYLSRGTHSSSLLQALCQHIILPSSMTFRPTGLSRVRMGLGEKTASPLQTDLASACWRNTNLGTGGGQQP